MSRSETGVPSDRLEPKAPGDPDIVAQPARGPRWTVGRACVEALIARGTSTIFGLPGVQLDALFSALHDCASRIRVIDSRHEQGAAYMAFGYAEASSRPGVFTVVPGPGVLNAGAALATAYACGSPVLGLVGQIELRRIGANTGDLHDLPDQTGIVTRLVKHHRLVREPAEAPEAVNALLDELEVAGGGPAVVELPSDVLAAPAAVSAPAPPSARPPAARRPLPSVEAATRSLREARRPLLFVGRGAVHAFEQVRTLSRSLGGVPVVAQGRAKGILPDADPVALPLLAAAALWNDADAVVAIGTRLRHPLRAWTRPTGQKLIVIDGSELSAPAVRLADHRVVGDAKEVLAAIASGLRDGDRGGTLTAWRDRAATVKQSCRRALEAALAPQMSWVAAIRAGLPENGVIVTDYTQIGYVANVALPVQRPGSIITPGYQGTLGFAFPAALGAKAAAPNRPVLAVAGDGGFMFSASELATAVKHRIGVVTIVFNDSRYANVQRMQIDAYGGRVIASDLVNPDFLAFARSFGARAHRVDRPDALPDHLSRAFAEELPTVIEVVTPMLPDPWPFIYPPDPAGAARSPDDPTS